MTRACARVFWVATLALVPKQGPPCVLKGQVSVRAAPKEITTPHALGGPVQEGSAGRHGEGYADSGWQLRSAGDGS